MSATLLLKWIAGIPDFEYPDIYLNGIRVVSSTWEINSIPAWKALQKTTSKNIASILAKAFFKKI